MGYLHLDELRPGQILQNDLISEKGRMFLAEGTVLTENLIRRFRELEISYVSILEVDDGGKPEGEARAQYRIDEEKFQNVYNSTYGIVKELLQRVWLGNSVNLDDMKDTVGTFIALVLEDYNVVPKLHKMQRVDEYTFRHSLNVGLLSVLIGKWLDMRETELRKLAYAGVFHDIGKGKIPSEIINKPSPLNEEEWELMKQHPIYGYDMLKKTSDLSDDVLMGVLMHHERENGSGYPSGLEGNKIHPYAKIIAVADIFDAMMSDRSYRKRESPFRVVEVIGDCSFDTIDPIVARVFMQGIYKYFVGSHVKLNDGRIGQVIYIYPQQPTKPIVMVGEEFIDFSRRSDVSILEIVE